LLRIVRYPPSLLLLPFVFCPWLLSLASASRRPGGVGKLAPNFLIFFAYYPNKNTATEPRCPSAYLQWQHGEYMVNPDGSIDLHPIQVDGRQLKSDHCTNDKAIYTRFNQTERLKWYEVLTDSYRGKKRLNLYQSDGSPVNPMYLRFDSPQILPTTTLNPLITSTVGGAQQTGAGDAGKRKVRLKRELPVRKPEEVNADRWWWIGVGMTAAGGVGWYCF